MKKNLFLDARGSEQDFCSVSGVEEKRFTFNDFPENVMETAI